MVRKALNETFCKSTPEAILSEAVGQLGGFARLSFQSRDSRFGGEHGGLIVLLDYWERLVCGSPRESETITPKISTASQGSGTR